MSASHVNFSYSATTTVRFLLNVLAWTLLFFFPFIMQVKLPAQAMEDFWLIRTVSWGLLISLFYLNYSFLVPKLLDQRRFLLYVSLILVILVSYGSFIYLVNRLHGPRNDFPPIQMRVMGQVFVCIFLLVVGAGIRTIASRIKEERIRKEKETENLKTEMGFLRSQISPHFMFNVLNSVVSLVRSNSDQVEPTLLQLSSLMRYSLSSNEELVPIRKEVGYLDDYLQLQKLRFGKEIDLQFAKNIPDPELAVAPLLLIPFVENAFKHGMVADGNCYVHIDLDSRQGLSFTVQNSHAPHADTKAQSNGIGLVNVKRRLELLYPDQHQLLIQPKDKGFRIHLQINLLP